MANSGSNGVSIGGGRHIRDLQTAPNNASGGGTATQTNNLLPKNGEWINQMTGNLNKTAGLRNSPPPGDISIDVPVRQSDTQWDIVQRSLPLLAKRSGLGAESQKVFAEKWAARLEESGEKMIYDNSDGGRVDGGDFAARIDRTKANTSGIGTYKLTFTAKNHGEMLADIQRLRRNEILTNGIADPELRRQTLGSINSLTVGTGHERAAAAQELWRMGQSGQPEAAKIYDSVKVLARYEDLQLNAAVKMTELLLDADKTLNQMGPRDSKFDEIVRLRLSEITLIAARDDITDNPTGATGKADRPEAAFVNREAAALYQKIGDKPEAYRREMIGRYYEADDHERNKTDVIFGVGIERWKITDTPIMRAATPEELALRRYNRKNGTPQQPKKDLAEDPQKRQFNPKDKYVIESTVTGGKLGRDAILKGDIVAAKLPETTFQQEGALRTESKQLSSYIRVNEKGAVVNPSGDYYKEKNITKNLEYESPVLNPKGTQNAMRVAGVVGGLEEINKWGSFLGDLYNNTTANKIAERQKLEKAAYNATHFPVPPKIEDLPKFRRN
nr:hypothetical protein [Acidobacteriota bacterium]